MKKDLEENIVEKGEIAQNEQFHLYVQCCLFNPLISTFQLLCAALSSFGRGLKMVC